jgi:3-oxoadipate enol-lactonase
MTVPTLAVTAPEGAAGAPVLLLGPSLGSSTLLWEDTLPELQKHFRVQLWDLPGHGRSPAASESFTVAEIAEAVLDAVADPEFFYAGVSFGGTVGLELLLAAPARVRAAAIVCSGAKIGTAKGWAERAALVRTQGTASLVVPSASRWFAPGSIERRPEITGRLLHSLRDADDESYALCAEALADFDVRDRLRDITAPMLALWGEHDAVTDSSLAEEIARGVRVGRAQRIDDASHLAPAEQPAAVAAALIDHFTNHTTDHTTGAA